MATEVSSLLRILNSYSCNDDQMVRNDSGKSTALITRDLLGGGSSSSFKIDDSQELDLDLQVPRGYEKRLDLKSGKVYLQRCNSLNSFSSSSSETHKKHQINQTVPKFQDLNYPPSSLSSKPAQIFFDETSLDLKLIPSSSPSSSSSPSLHYQSVCTLDKVKSALERAGRESTKKRSSFSISSSSPSNSSSSIKVNQEEIEEEERLSMSPNGLLFAAGCPGCLLYVMISKINPQCPRCHSMVPLPVTKKPRIDLNISI